MSAGKLKAINTLLWPIGLIIGTVLYFLLTSRYGQAKELREIYWTIFNILVGGTIIGLASYIARQIKEEHDFGARLLGFILGVGYNFIIIFAFFRMLIDPNKTIYSFTDNFNNLNQFGILLAFAVYGSISLMQNVKSNKGAWLLYVNASLYFATYVFLVILIYSFFGDLKKGSWPGDVSVLLNKTASLLLPYVFMTISASAFFVFNTQDDERCTIRKTLFLLSAIIVLFCISSILVAAISGKGQPEIWVLDFVNSIKWIAFVTGGIVNAIYQIREA